jgi:hypothetical protein
VRGGNSNSQEYALAACVGTLSRYPDPFTIRFPQHWKTERTRIDVVRAAEAEVLTALFNSSSDFAESDPTFHAVHAKEVLGHIDDSQRCETLERGGSYASDQARRDK